MPSFRDHLPLAIVSMVLSIAIFILFKDVRAVKAQAAAGARFAASYQEQLQQQPPQFQIVGNMADMPPRDDMVPLPESAPTECEIEPVHDEDVGPSTTKKMEKKKK